MFTITGVRPAKTNLGEFKMQKILDSAETIFLTKNFYATSISDICKQAGIAVGTFYIYFDDKKAVYTYLIQKYKHLIRQHLHKSISSCTTRADKEREGILAFVRFAVTYPQCFNILWGSLSVDKQLFEDYYVSFAESYAKSLAKDNDQLNATNYTTLAYCLMGITNFVALKAIMEKNLTDQQLQDMVTLQVMPLLYNGVLK